MNRRIKGEFEIPPIRRKNKYHISNMDITFNRELSQEEMEKIFFSALYKIGVTAYKGCPR